MKRRPSATTVPLTTTLAFAASLVGCAGELEAPDQFAFLLQDAGASSVPSQPVGNGDAGGQGPLTGDGDGAETGDGDGPPSGDGDGAETGDGDGPPSGDGDGPPSGDGDGAATGDGDGDMDSIPVNLPDPSECAVEILSERCDSSVCHGAGAAQVDLVSDGLSQRLFDQPATPGGVCVGRDLVPADGSPSLMMDKLEESPSCGLAMPLAGDSLSDSDKACLQEYVDALQEAAP